ncbi:hypothetical protein E3N88_26365 [Mikania micrantha]|uniref:Chromo domain-containing protein n=1 Tax=Mikania micrantha TaxID=192012 RepID=A0A5N6N8T3_9ASTR|nr:hypothetical protein E3N88_26365 [Mikania micrantha]
MDLKPHPYSIKGILKPRFFSHNHLYSHCWRSVISLFFQKTGFGCKGGDIVIRNLIRCILKIGRTGRWNFETLEALDTHSAQPFSLFSRQMARTRGRPANRRNDNDNARNIDPALLAAVNQAVENAIAQSVPQAVANALQNNRREPNNEQPENNDPPVLWKNHTEREATWELEDSIRERYPQLFH